MINIVASICHFQLQYHNPRDIPWEVLAHVNYRVTDMKKLVNPAFSLNQVHVFITSTMSTGVLHAHEVLIKSIYFMHG